MKAAGELPSVGMKCMVAIIHDDCEAVITHIGDKVGCAINKSTGKEFNFTCATGDFIFKPIDTRTAEQKQVDSAVQDIHSAMFELSDETATDLVRMLQQRGHLGELS